MSIWRNVYGFIRREEGRGVTAVDVDVLEDFQATLHLSVFLEAPMNIPRSTQVKMMDASPTGATVIITDASVAEIRAEARFTETRGWATVLEEVADATEKAAAALKLGDSAFVMEDSSGAAAMKAETTPAKFLRVLHFSRDNVGQRTLPIGWKIWRSSFRAEWRSNRWMWRFRPS